MVNINKFYFDIDLEMKMDWNKDVFRLFGLRLIKNSFLGIIIIRKGLRLFDFEFGCDLLDQFFENMIFFIVDMVECNIESVVRNYELCIDKLVVNVIFVYDDYILIVEIRFLVIDNFDDIEQIKLQLVFSNRV